MESIPPPIPEEQCKGCGSAPEKGYRIPLCPDCRTKLANRPLPIWIKIAGLAVFAALCYALSRVPTELSAGIAFERGHKAEAKADYAAAVRDYKKVQARFPDSQEVTARLGIAQFHNHEFSEAVTTLRKLEGQKASDALTSEVNGVVDQLNKEH